MECCKKLQELQEAFSLLKKENEKLKRDQLTRVYNRHYLDECLLHEYKPQLNTRANWYYNIILIDLDNLHNINREQGYDKGDEFILKIVSKLQKEMNKQNVSGKIFRIGGDEFLIIYQPYDVLDIDNIPNITYAKGKFDLTNTFKKVIKELDKQIIKQKESKNER